MACEVPRNRWVAHRRRGEAARGPGERVDLSPPPRMRTRRKKAPPAAERAEPGG